MSANLLKGSLKQPMKTQKNESFPGGDIKAALSIAGLSKKAGRLAVGTDKVCDDIRGAGTVRLVAAAEDISANTDKRISDCCKWHGVQLEKCPFTSEQLGAALGRESGIACAGFTDEGFSKAFLARLGRPRVKPENLSEKEEAEFDNPEPQPKSEPVKTKAAGDKNAEKTARPQNKQRRFGEARGLRPIGEVKYKKYTTKAIKPEAKKPGARLQKKTETKNKDKSGL